MSNFEDGQPISSEDRDENERLEMQIRYNGDWEREVSYSEGIWDNNHDE